MEGNSLVSILIPNFNKAPYLKDTLDSVISQTYPYWECIVVDDLSTDDSWEILESYAKKDTRIKIIKRPENRKKGGNAARNIAIEKANGEYVAFLDSDDTWNSGRLMSAIKFISGNHFSAIYSAAVIYDGKRKKIQLSREILSNESVFDFVVREDTFAPTPSLLLKRDIAKNVLFDEEMERHQDFDFFIRVSKICSWHYFENFDVQINWDRNHGKKINYQACIPFYEKHWTLSNDKSVRHSYIKRLASLSSRRNPENTLVGYFKNILKREGYRFSTKEHILFNYPYLFHYFSKIKDLFRTSFFSN